jgi:hypothetical protein
MSMPTREEPPKKFPPFDDPESEARQQWIVEILLEAHPYVKQRLWETYKKAFDKGRLLAVRAALCQVLRGRGLELQPVDEARIEACEHLGTLMQWHAQAVTASSVAEALR